jgi:hypothetical protein
MIESSLGRIYGILIDGVNAPKWNPTVREVLKEQDGNYLLKTYVGDVLIIGNKTEMIENECVVWHMKDSDMDSIGYKVALRGDLVEVSVFVEFENAKLSKIFERAQKNLLNGLKRYVEYLEEGGVPEKYDKRELLVSP